MAGEQGREAPRHPMGVAVQRTGLTSHVLRAWERRYGAVEPGRTEGGQRLYSDADVVRLQLLRRVTEGGRAIGSVAGLPTEELVALVGEDERQAAGAGRGESGVGEGVVATAPAAGFRDGRLRACLEAANRMDARVLHAELMRGVVGLSAPEFLTGVVAPLLARVGDLWESGELRPAQEHVVSTAVRQVLDWLLGRYDAPPSAPLVVVGTPAGELHEFGAMMAAVMAAEAGWRVLYLGPSLPAEEVAVAAERAGASAVAMSVVDGEAAKVDRAGEELRVLRSLLPERMLLVTGGRRSPSLTPEGATRVTELDGFRKVLSAVVAGDAPDSPVASAGTETR